MPLNQSQIEKLKSIPNRINIYGDFSKNLKELQRTTNGSSEDLKKFIEKYEEEIKKMPLSSLRNDLGSNFQEGLMYDYNTVVSIISSNGTFLPRKTTIFDITPDRVVAGFVTSGTGVLTDKYATDSEIIFIEDETGSIGVIIENSLTRGMPNGALSIGTANTYPVLNNSHQIGQNLPSNDYRHNIRIGDLIIIQSGKYNPGVGYAYEDPQLITSGYGSKIRSNQGVSVIESVNQYLIDSEFRGISPTPYGLNRGDRIHTLSGGYNWRTMNSDNRLVTLIGEFEFVDIAPEYKTLSGKDISFLPNKTYLVKTDEINAQKNTHRGLGILKVVISQTSELARFRVKIPNGRFNYISGIVMQDSESDERLLFPRFLGDIYPIDSIR